MTMERVSRLVSVEGISNISGKLQNEVYERWTSNDESRDHVSHAAENTWKSMYWTALDCK